MRAKLLFAVLAAQAVAFCQIDRSPVPFPGGGPGGPWGGSRAPFPVPRRGGQGPASPDQVPTRTAGKVRQVNERSLVLEAQDGRTVEFLFSRDTRFYKDSKQIQASEVKIGDQVSVEATEDRRGRLLARSVYLEDRRPDKEETASAEPRPEAPRDPDDPGPPVLRRGIPEKREAGPVGETAGKPAEDSATPDPYLEKARSAAVTFSQGLPNYVAKEVMARFASSSRPVNWQPLDVVSMEVVYEDGKESYRNLTLGGRPTSRRIQDLGGAWSTGEFASMLLDLFSPSTAAEFIFRGNSNVSGVQGRLYDFNVLLPHSHWHVQTESQSINPAYKGSVWIEPQTGRTLRIEMQAASLPEAFPLDTVESAVEYANVRIGSGEFLLPVHAETLMCRRGTPDCSRNTLDFRNYHKFEAESNLAFGSSRP